MTIDNGIAVGVVTAVGAVVVWAVRLEGRMNLHEDRHATLARVVDGIKADVRSGVSEIRDASKEFRIEMQKEFRYVKGRVDNINASLGNRALLRRDNEDDRANTEEDR